MRTVIRNKDLYRETVTGMQCEGHSRVEWLKGLAFSLNLPQSSARLRQEDRIYISRKIIANGGYYTFSGFSKGATQHGLQANTNIILIDDDIRSIARSLRVCLT
jgi:hypothetical protein